MSWFKVDDKMPFHRKILKAGNAAVGAWVRMGAHSAAQGADGFVADEEARLIGSGEEIAKLVSVVLLEVVEGGFQLHDFLAYNPSGAEVRARQSNRRHAGRIGGQRSAVARSAEVTAQASAQAHASPDAQASAEAPAQANTEQPDEAKSNPVPSRPVPSREIPPTPQGAAASVPELHRIGEVYAEAIREITGHPFGLPRSAGRDFAEIAKSLAPKVAALERVEWFRTSAQAFARATKDDPIANQGFAPSRFLAWLNAGSPPTWARAPGKPPAPIVTPSAPYHEEWQPPAPSE